MNSTAALTAPDHAPRASGSARPQVAPRAWLALLGCWLSLVAVPAAAAPTGASWLCWYDAEVSVVCRLLRNPLDEAPVGAGKVAAVIPPAAEPQRRDNLPEVARQIWYHADELQGTQVRIPLFAEPFDMGFVRELAEAVMCGSVAACQVRFLESRGELALLLDELEDAS